MNKNILNKGILIPLAIGIVLAIAVFCAFLGMNKFFPVNDGAVVMYYDQNGEQKQEEGASYINIADLKDNQKIGYLSFGKTSLDIRYKSNYSNMIDCFSLTDGSVFGEFGVGYLEVFKNNIYGLNKSDIVVKSDFGNHKYRYVFSYETNNKNDVFVHQPGVEKGIVIYYQKADGYGFSSKCQCLVYEEVQ